jgi:hypothetical protein
MALLKRFKKGIVTTIALGKAQPVLPARRISPDWEMNRRLRPT